MNGITKLGLALSAAVLVAACGSSDNDTPDNIVTPPPPPPASTFVRVHHSVADAPDVNVLVDGTAALEGVPFGASSGVLELEEGSYSIQVDGILPDESVATVIGPADLEFAGDNRYEIFAVGSVADETIAPLVIENPVSDIPDGSFRVQVVHAAPNAPAVDVYLTAVDADLSAEQPAATLEFTDYSAQLDVPAGEYQVRITAAGDASAVVYDSGALDLAAGADLVVAAVTNTGTGDSPVMLQVADGESAQILASADAGGELRIVHASADAPAVDITVNNAATPAVADLAFLEFTDFINLPADTYLVDVAAAGGTPVVIDDAELALAASQRVSVYAVGALGDSSLTLAVVEDNARRIATAAQVQLVHASPSAGNVDIYVTGTADLTDATPVFTDVPFNAASLVSTGYVSLTPGTYFVTVTATGTQTAAIGPVELTLDGNGVYTAVAVDATGGGLPPQLILMDDLAPAM
ncbi:hypothetical protein CWI82_01445 [Pseudidiomarina tainanensis]|uniref:Uncharacterized protein n=1 Tax=Pseudidiomarina tainanensis TaxID=502365 RepID=A0ACD2HHG0_9GAMM|nr:DUF4397 domain-containing protein [Pseudidiomarina tainanensis]RZQ56005.1 hypothetical protein CWI82_01445 [Pseudidiomarina tainanensis]